MATAGVLHIAVLQPDGRVLAAGGSILTSSIAKAEVHKLVAAE